MNTCTQHLPVPPPLLTKNKNIFINLFRFLIMDKKDLVARTLDKVVTEKAVNALAEGKGTRAVGAPLGVSVDNTYTILGIDYREDWFAPNDSNLTREDIAEMSDDEKAEAGCRFNGWFYFTTNNGDLSFTAVLGDSEMTKPEFWEGVETKAEDFDSAKIFVPSARTPAAWIKSGCDNLVGKTLKCVATKDFKRGQYPTKARAFVLVA